MPAYKKKVVAVSFKNDAVAGLKGFFPFRGYKTIFSILIIFFQGDLCKLIDLFLAEFAYFFPDQFFHFFPA